jgi:hypothetical protein
MDNSKRDVAVTSSLVVQAWRCYATDLEKQGITGRFLTTSLGPKKVLIKTFGWDIDPLTKISIRVYVPDIELTFESAPAS